MPLITVVIPAYNEEANVGRVYERLSSVFAALPVEWELIFSVDPSTDRTEEKILELRAQDPRVKMLRFSRRFGQPAATLAGMEAAEQRRRGRDRLRSPGPAGADRGDDRALERGLRGRLRAAPYARGETFAKRVVAAVGYRVIKRISDVEIPPNTGDFRLMSRRVVDNVVALREEHGFRAGWSRWSASSRPRSSTTATRARPATASTTGSSGRS